MNTKDLWFNIIPHILPGLQSFPEWRSRESLGLEGRGVCLWRTCFPTSMNHMYNHPNCILSGEVTKTPISGPNGFLVLWVNATGMPLNKCLWKALSQCCNLWQPGCGGAFLHSTRQRSYVIHLAWITALAAKWWPSMQVLFKHLLLFFNKSQVWPCNSPAEKHVMALIICRIETKLLNL